MSDLTSILDFEEEFDPLEVDDNIIDQEDMDDDNPYDTVDYPTMREMPPDPYAGQTYTPEVKGSAQEAMLSLFDHNPARRPVLLGILNVCKGGTPASEVKEFVDEYQRHNKSVYSASTLCRMLRDAGGLTLTKPELTKEVEDVEEGVEYLEIKERVDPVWTTTPEGEQLYEDESQGRYFWEIMDRDGKYIEVYRDVLKYIEQAPRSIKDICDIVDDLEIVQRPRRFGGHFVDMLERTDAIIWRDNAWNITDLGRSVLPRLNQMTLKVVKEDA